MRKDRWLVCPFLKICIFRKILEMNPTTITYSAKMKMAEIVCCPEQLSILERLNIRLGFGEATIEEICGKYGLSTNLFILICNIYTSDSYVPSIEGLTKSDVPKIVSYLKKTHSYWLEQCFPRLHANIHAMLQSCDAINQRVLNQFYDDYDAEVEKHLAYEENVVFPYVMSVIQGEQNSKYHILDFEKNHSDIDEKLRDLKNIIVKYLSDDQCASNHSVRIDVLNDIFKIETDLNKHTLIENSLLIPLVSKIEKGIL